MISLLTTDQELKVWRAPLKRSQVLLIPTMGALHAGHLELVSQAQRRHPEARICVTVFVNPTQFGPQEDFSRYPRTLTEDLRVLSERAQQLQLAHPIAVFAPVAEEVYPQGFSLQISETRLSQCLCGPLRPGHFSGVLTVVLRLFEWIRPGTAIFGKKDAQQFLILSKMVRDLGLPIEMIGAETVREADGLAMSSRNRYLSPQERAQAPALFQALGAIASSIRTAHRAATQDSWAQAVNTCATYRASLEKQGFEMQYMEIRSLPDLEALEAVELSKRQDLAWVVAGAGYLGKTRLIDNLWVS